MAIFKEQNTFFQTIKNFFMKWIQEERPNLAVYEITDINKNGSGQITQYSANIKDLNQNKQFSEVPITGTGLGNLRGIYKTLKTGDFVVVGWLDKNTPIILGSVSDFFTQSPDNIPVIDEDEMIMVAKEKGALIYFDKNNNIIVRSVDSSGAISGGARFKLSPDGSFKLFDKENYGIESDGSGNVTIYGDLTINGSVSSLQDSLSGAVTSLNPKSAGSF